MSASLLAGTAAQLNVGKVIGEGFAVIRRHWQTYLVCALAVSATEWGSGMLTAAAHVGEPAAARDASANVILVLYSVVLFLVVQPLIVNVMAWTAWADAASGSADLGVAVAAVRRRAGRLLLAYLVLIITLIVGFLLLVIPGIWLSLALVVTVPASVVEDLGPQAALRRSLDLTRGQRWRIFLFSMLVGLMAIGASFILSVALMVGGLNIGEAANPVAVLLAALEQGLVAVFVAALTGRLYAELVRIKGGGIGAAATAEVFA